jgi:hypothetical protein
VLLARMGGCKKSGGKKVAESVSEQREFDGLKKTKSLLCIDLQN